MPLCGMQRGEYPCGTIGGAMRAFLRFWWEQCKEPDEEHEIAVQAVLGVIGFGAVFLAIILSAHWAVVTGVA